MRLGIVASRFNEELCEKLLQGATAEAARLGVKDVVVEKVPGALEIPLALQWMAQSGRFDCLAAIGCVVRGDTYHFEVVANESARGLMDVALEFGIPVANGILTTDDEAQARRGGSTWSGDAIRDAELARAAYEQACREMDELFA